MSGVATSASLIHRDDWLSGVMQQPVFQVQAGPLVAPPELLSRAVRDHQSSQSVAMYFAKVAADRLDLVHALGDAGMRPIDMAITFELERRPAAVSVDTAGMRVADCSAGDAEAVLDIAGTSFVYSRFHLDPRIPDDLAHRVKREWIASYVRGARGERLLVASLGGRVAGFLAVLAAGSPQAPSYVIDLIAVAGWGRRRGVARALVQAFIDRYAGTGAALRVGTQAANVPSVRMYEQLGFSLTGSQYVLHAHVRDGAAL